MTDYYAALGVPKTATADEIKQAFRRLASQHHPDKGGDTAKFQSIQEAYATLGDEQKRAEYDNPKPQFGNFGGGFGHPQFNDIFNQMFGQNFAQQHAKRGHVRMHIWVTLSEIAQGVQKTVNVNTSAGTSTVQIQVPFGINDGDNVQYSGMAPGGIDLVVQYRVQPDPNWQRDGLNLYTNVSLSVWDLIRGTTVEITSLEGKILGVSVPVRCQPNQLLRVRGHGMSNGRGTKGDILVRVQTFIPDQISPELLDAIQNYT